MRRHRTTQFTATAKWLHWTVAFLMLSILPVAIGFSYLDSPDRAEAIPVHASLAIIVLVLTLARLGWRAAFPPPPIPDASPGWTKSGAKAGHALLYGLIFWQSVLGLWMAASSPVDIRFFNDLNLSNLAPENPDVIALLRPLHRAGAWLFALVLTGHICGALWHHFKLRDDVLIRMLPFSGLAQDIMAKGRFPDWRFPSKNGIIWPKGKY